MSLDYPTKYLYTLPGCALGHHYKAFHWLPLVQITKGPSCTIWYLGESTPLPTHSQPDRSTKSQLYPIHRLVRKTSLYHIYTTPGYTHVGS
jgi:hypothetical protein